MYVQGFFDNNINNNAIILKSKINPKGNINPTNEQLIKKQK